jgi:hypothetical protein
VDSSESLFLHCISYSQVGFDLLIAVYVPSADETLAIGEVKWITSHRPQIMSASFREKHINKSVKSTDICGCLEDG